MLTSVLYSISFREFSIGERDNKRLIEDSLEEFSFSYWAVPSTAPDDVVRMAGQTEHGHSFLQFSNKNVQLTINFDEKFNKELTKCLEYAHDKLNKLINVLEHLSVKIVSNGAVAQYIYDEIEDPVQELKKKILCIDVAGEPLHNLGAYFSIIHKDMYYVNIEFSSLANDAQKKHALGVKIDVNDKYGVGKTDVIPNVNDILKVVSIQDNIDQNVIMRLLEEGKFELHEQV